MPTDIDSLQIQINAQASKANDAIDRLVGKIDKLTTSLTKVDGSKLNGLASGVSQLGTAMQTMNAVKTADFTRLAKNLTSLNNIDTSKLSGVSANVTAIGQSLSGLSGVTQGAQQLTELANGIKQLGYKSADKAITNIPQLATAMKQMMKELSTAPKVSQNLIDMTNALAKLARTGASSGKAAQSLSKSFTSVHKSSSFAVSGIKKINSHLVGLTRSIMPVVGLIGLIDFGKQAMEISSDLTEVQNVVDVTFGGFKQKIEDLASVSIPELGMSELSVKQIGSRFQAMGTAMGFSTEKMSDMSVELTRLTGDMASFYNVSTKDVGKALQSIFTGETEPMRRYGVDLTNATIQQYALSQGITKSVSSMTQLEKATLRYQYVMEHTNAAQGDFLRTQDTWANQVRMLTENLKELAKVIGGSLINAFKPLVSAMNQVAQRAIAFAETVTNALGAIFGWKYESGGGFGEDWADSMEDYSSATGEAADNAKKLKQNLLGIDELNINSGDENGSSGGSAGIGSVGNTEANYGQIVPAETIFKNFESGIDSLYGLGEHIGNAITDTMARINWSTVYEKARSFGTGLADFLNGLISPELFGAVGRTIAGALNTAVDVALSFGEKFDWEDFGLSIATGINEFFATFEFADLANTIDVWVQGVWKTVKTAIAEIKWEDVWNGAKEFLENIDIETVEITIGAFLIKNTAKNLASLLLKALTGKFAFSLKISEVLLSISSFSAANMSGASFQIFASWIVEEIEETLEELLPEGIKDALGGAVAGFVTGGIAGYWIPGIGPLASGIAGAILGAIISAFPEEIKNVSDKLKKVLEDILSPIFNWDSTKEVWESAKENFKEGGINIVLGISEGILSGIGFLIEPIGDLFSFVVEQICEVFGIHSPAEEMKPLGENILFGIIEGFSSVFDSFTESMSIFWNDHVSPWFTPEKWYELGDGMLLGIQKKWNETAEQWKKNIKSWWENSVSPWFTLKKWSDLLLKIPEAFKSTFKNAANSAIEIFNKLIDWINAKMHISWEAINIAGKEIVPKGNVQLFTITKIPTFSTGGFPEDGWFRASKGEYFGQFDDGTSYIANNNQIELGVAVGVKEGVKEAVAEILTPYLIEIAQNTRETADKDFDVSLDSRSLLDGLNQRNTRNGFSFT